MNNQEVVKVLQKAKQVLLNNKFGKGAFAKKANGHTRCSPSSKDAKCFCALGAVHRAVKYDYMDPSTSMPYVAYEALVYLEKALNAAPVTVLAPTSVTTFNDLKGTQKSDVIELFNKAINLAKGETNE